MSRPIHPFHAISVLASLLVAGCSGGGGGGSGLDVAAVFNSRTSNLYVEVPVIEIQGNDLRDFNPKSSRIAELYDSDGDGIPDSPINDFNSIANAANRLLDEDLAACVKKGDPVLMEKHLGYLEPLVWSGSELPDRMPATADSGGTDGTQFIQLILPFNLHPASIFDDSSSHLDFLDPDAVTIEDEDGNHVFCTVLVNGRDKDGGNDYTDHPNWPELRGVNTAPGAPKSSIVFIAQAGAGVLGQVPSHQAFSAWTDGNEIRIHLKTARNDKGELIDVNSKWYVLREGGIPADVKVISIEASDPVKGPGNSVIIDPDGGHVLVNRTSNFVVRFNKPVIPETLGQSIVFKQSPFNGNIAPLPTSLVLNPPPANQNPCDDNGTHRDPIATNVAVISTLIYEDGTVSNIEGTIPFRCHPLHQNNLCTYVLNPVIELPGSTDLGNPPFADPKVDKFTRMRIIVKVYLHDENSLTGTPVEVAPGTTTPYPPVNMGVTGYFGLLGEIMSAEAEATFTVTSGGRYVNAPVSPHALYYAMGPQGMGVVDLDGNGFTTNDPDFSRPTLVTSQAFYNPFGNAGLGIGNAYSYAAKATIPPGGGQPVYVGLGSNTPMPGINEGSAGIDEVVRDSNGNASIYPDPDGPDKFSNITDIEVGDFLDTLFWDRGNKWASKSLHLSAINQAALGSYSNNLISTPPTPNPPPLTIPIAMRPTHVILDEFDIIEEGAFVIMSKEVFTVDLPGIGVGLAPNTGFVHLEPAAMAGSPVDLAFPPNAATWVGGKVDYMNLGPVAESSTIGMGYFYGSRQQIGNFLFAADKANNTVRVLNSNTMEVITSLTGLSGPDSVAVTPDLNTLYVSNSGGQSVSVFNVNPRSEHFLDKTANILVGSHPKGICVQPEMDDVFVCNFGNDTISVINPKTNTVRKTLSSLVKKPWDMVAGPRQMQFGFGTQVYHAYISNYGGDNVLVYESGPDGLGGVGFDNILDPIPATGENGQQFLPIQSPRGLCWDPIAGTQFPLSGGCYVAHRTGSFGVVSHIAFTAQQAPWGPIFLIPNSGSIGGTPGFGKRVFLITSQWGGLDNPLSGSAAADVAMLDYNRNAWLNDSWTGNFDVTNLGDISGPQSFLPINNKSPLRTILGAYRQTVYPDRLYISFQSTPVIDVINPQSSNVAKTITGLPSSAKVLKTYFKN